MPDVPKLVLFTRKKEEKMDWIQSWKDTLFLLLDDVPASLRPAVASVAIDGTSATTIIMDRSVP